MEPTKLPAQPLRDEPDTLVEDDTACDSATWPPYAPDPDEEVTVVEPIPVSANGTGHPPEDTYRCPSGHITTGQFRYDSNSATGALEATSGPLCRVCVLQWAGEQFRTFLVNG
jgi:hypothetical protein